MSNIVESRQHVEKRYNPTLAVIGAVLGMPFALLGVWIFIRVIGWAQEHAAALVPWLIALGIAAAVIVLIVATFVLIFHIQRARARQADLEEKQAAALFNRNLAEALLFVARDSSANFTATPDRALTVTRSFPQPAQRVSTRIAEEQNGMLPLPPAKEVLQLASPKIEPIYYRDVVEQVPTGHMILGVRRDQSVRTGKWGTIKTFLAAGKSGSGKTVTVASKAFEARRQINARFIEFDPHFHKEDSLSNRIASLKPYLFPGTDFAWEDDEMVRVIGVALLEYERRRKGGRIDFPLVILGDEVNRLIDDRAKQFVHPLTREKVSMSELVTEVIQMCGREGRGFGVFGVFGAQELIGLAKIRRAVHSIAFHRTKSVDDLARLLKGQQAEETLHLPTGACLLLDDDGEVEWLQQVITDGSEMETETPDEFPSVTGSLVYDHPSFHSAPTMPLVTSERREASKVLPFRESYREAAQEVRGSAAEAENEIDADTLKKVLRYVGKRVKNGEDPGAIRKELGITGGRALQEFNAALEVLSRESEAR